MPTRTLTALGCCGSLLAALHSLPAYADNGAVSAAAPRVERALSNISTLVRPGRDGYATVWDGNKYVQCRRMPDQSLRCEAAGTLMQPSLAHILVPDRIGRLAEFGWHLDTSFGNYVRIFPAGAAPSYVAERLIQVLTEVYDADPENLGVQSDWIVSEPCPPRNGPSQNLAGMINDDPEMAAYAVHGCAFQPDEAPPQVAKTAGDLIETYGARVSGEIQRLRVNFDRWVFMVLDTGGGYIQCGSQSSPPAIYCEAQSADSWPVLARILTPDRIARLHTAGFNDPGRLPNYWKTYPLDTLSDAAVTEELLTILFEAYGYRGDPTLRFVTEKGED